jgi:hypothetical protein
MPEKIDNGRSGIDSIEIMKRTTEDIEEVIGGRDEGPPGQ